MAKNWITMVWWPKKSLLSTPLPSTAPSIYSFHLPPILSIYTRNCLRSKTASVPVHRYFRNSHSMLIRCFSLRYFSPIYGDHAEQKWTNFGRPYSQHFQNVERFNFASSRNGVFVLFFQFRPYFMIIFGWQRNRRTQSIRCLFNFEVAYPSVKKPSNFRKLCDFIYSIQPTHVKRSRYVEIWIFSNPKKSRITRQTSPFFGFLQFSKVFFSILGFSSVF